MKKNKIKIRRKIKGNILKDKLNQSRSFLIEIRNEIILASLLLIIFTLTGYVFPGSFEMLQKEFLEKVVAKVPTDNMFSTILYIIQNNVKASFISMMLGITIIFPFIALGVNGFILGAVMNHAVEIAGISVTLRLLPHGIFEIPAIIIANAIGIKIGLGLFRKESLAENFKKGVITFFLIIIPLLLIAGILEGIFFYIIK